MLADLEEAKRLACIAELERVPLPRLREYVPGYDSILLCFDRAVLPEPIEAWLSGVDAARAEVGAGRGHRIRVLYDGPDLEAVAAAAGMPAEDVIRRHAAPEYRVRMSGFSPGFPYLDGLDPELQVPRRSTPRTAIEAGSVAIGGPHAGIYTVASPGGWHVLGRTNFNCFRREAAAGFEPDARTVFPLAAGDRLRFEPVERLADE